MKTVSDSLQTNTLLDKLHQTVRYIKKLTRSVEQFLPATLKKHCQVANYQNGLLVLQTDNAAWATQLRYLLPELQKKLKLLPEFTTLQSMRIFIAPHTTQITPKYKPIEISAESAQVILDIAEHTPGKLGEALKKLALHGVK